jgi:hypothetical protein
VTRTVGVYQVIGNREYRGHKPGTTFEAILDPGPERRAIDRGDIRLIERITPSIRPGTLTMPDGWPPPARGGNNTNTEAPDEAPLP